MKRTFREARRLIRAEYDQQLHAICRKYKVCTRCHDDSKPLETETMCLDCVEKMRAYQRKHWHIRVANGTATRGRKSKGG